MQLFFSQALGGFDLDKFPNVSNWLARCKTNMKGYETANQAGVDKMKEFIKTIN